MNPRRRTPSSLHLTWGLLGILALLNAASLWGIFSTRRGARAAAEHDLALRTTVFARSVEAELAALRADFLFLIQSPPLTALTDSLGSDDPEAEERSRPDAEGTLRLFLETHPEIRRLELEDAAGRVILVLGWQSERATSFPPTATPGTSTSWFQGRWPTDPGDSSAPALQAWIDQESLLDAVAPAAGELTLSVAPARPSTPNTPRRQLRAAVPVIASAWDPPVNWMLTAEEAEGHLLQSVEALTGLYGTTVAVNVLMMSLSLVLGLVAFRNLRRATLLEIEREQQERVRELERQLMHSERLASVGRLAAGLAHEINNPLEGVSNYLGLLKEDLAAGREKECGELLGLAREGVHRAADVIRQVLAYADPGRGTITTLDLRRVLEQSADFVRRSPEHRDLEIRLSLPDTPLAVNGNPVTLGQVFLNLLLNAGKAQPAGGSVRISTEGAGGTVRVRVADRGPGIGAEQFEHLFEPFYSTTGSTGLGLAISKSIVESHGGRLEAANRPDGGAVMTVELPLAREATS